MYAIKFGNPSHLESGETRAAYSDAVTVLNRVRASGETAGAIYKLSFDKDSFCNGQELKQSFGLPVSNMQKIKAPTPKLKVNNGVYAWECDHETIGICTLSNSKSKAVEEFMAAVRFEMKPPRGDFAPGVTVVEYEGELYHDGGRLGNK